jgi:hypothetical protein
MIDPSDWEDYLALRLANDQLREKGGVWLWETLQRLLAAHPSVELGRQPWEFPVERSVMVGERLGARMAGQTLLLEVGWPRRPEHGHVPGGGLARARLGWSQNVMLDPQPLANLILLVSSERSPRTASWYQISTGGTSLTPFTERDLSDYLERLFQA